MRSLDRLLLVSMVVAGCGDDASSDGAVATDAGQRQRADAAASMPAGAMDSGSGGASGLPPNAQPDGPASGAGGSTPDGWGKVQCDGRWREVRRTTTPYYCFACIEDACCSQMLQCEEAMGQESTCMPHLRCAANCVHAAVVAGDAPSGDLVAACVDACLDLRNLGGYWICGEWPAAFAPALQELVECFLSAPGLMVVDLEGNPAPPGFEDDADAGWMDNANLTPWRWTPKAAGDVPGECFSTCVPYYCQEQRQVGCSGGSGCGQ